MKSQAMDLTVLAENIYKDASAKCAAFWPEHRDLQTLRHRTEHEGLSFLTITLPNLGKDLEQALDQGEIGPTHFRSFSKCGKAPAFLQGFFGLVFSKTTGRIHSEPDLSAIEGLRQIAYAFKKLEVECSPERVKAALREFTQCELDIQEPTLNPDDTAHFRSVCHCLWGDMVSSRNFELARCVPKHGPGATADRHTGNTKYAMKHWYDRLEPFFPLLNWMLPNESAAESEEFENVTISSEEQELPVRVVTVPKTLKSPRIIAIEPTCMQYTQQAISKRLVEILESHRITKGHLNFKDQTVNQRLAITASITKRYATLDLSSASDRVLNSVASFMFESNPDLRDAIQACRSTRAQMPDGTILALSKFASMGSALCFPVEAMYFYTICVAARLKKHNLPSTTRNVFKMSRGVYVYGDDIIVPVDDAAAVIDHLHKYRCKVNASKSFWNGKFRESCGVDAYDGESVTPTYVRQVRPHNRQEAKSIIGWVKTSNQFYQRGYWKTSSYMMQVCEAILGKLPIVGPLCAGLGKVSFQHLVSSERWNKRYQVNEVKTWVATPVYQNDKLDGHAALMKCLLRLETGNTPVPIDAKHLMRTARYGAVTLKRRWTRPY